MNKQAHELDKRMQSASLVVEPYYQRNSIFDLTDKARNRDGAMYFAYALKGAMAKRGFDLQTDDLHSPHESEVSIYAEMPKLRSLFPRADRRSRSHVILFESELIRPDNWDPSNHKKFANVFTWHDVLVGSRSKGADAQPKFIKSNFAFKLPRKPDSTEFRHRKLITLIAGNKSVDHPLELYSARRQFIKWAEREIPEDFDYYGVGWERSYLSGGFIHKVLRKLNLLRFLPESPSRCYRGKVGDKLTVLAKFKYSLCFENAREIPGYITEKIFDSLIAGCVPVYWGAPNISDHIPPNCYIDYRQFLKSPHSLSALNEFLNGIDEAKWNLYQTAIANFLQSPAVKPFSADEWAEMIASHVVKN